MRKGGYEIVLTASDAEMSDYGLDPFRAFLCTFPHKLFPKKFLRTWYDFERNPDGTAKYALYGLRKVESILKDIFGDDNVVVVYRDDLPNFVGDNTKIIGISSMDPGGLAYVSTTYNSLIGFGGESLNHSEFVKLMNNQVFKTFKGTVVLGGTGVWQVKNLDMQKTYGIDILFHGEAEETLVPLIKKILAGQKFYGDYNAKKPSYTYIPLIKSPATFGMVEITRGCGRACQFCTPTMRKIHSIPIHHIAAEVEINAQGGAEMAFLATEDIFLYQKYDNFVPNRTAITNLLQIISNTPGIEYIQIAHASIAPVLADRTILDEITPILLEKTRWGPHYRKEYPEKFVTVEIGIESGSTRIIEKYMKGKPLPFSPKQWPELVVEGIGEYNDHEWRPLATLMTGLPDETENDLLCTLQLIDDIMSSKTFLVPLLFIPIEDAILGNEKRVKLDYLNELQWEFISRCWKHNINFWGKDVKWFVSPIIFGAYWLYGRWKHGRVSQTPVMKMIGIDKTIGKSYVNGCNPIHCNDAEKDVATEKEKCQ